MLIEERTEAEALPFFVEFERVALFADDNFFKRHPDKVLGEAFTSSGRFGEVTKYRGDLSALARIDVPLDFIGNEKTLENPLVSTSDTFNLSAVAMTPAVQDLLMEVNRKSTEATGRTLLKRRRTEEVVLMEDPVQTGILPELNAFEEMYRRYNPGISNEALEVFIWYKSSVGKPLSRRWVNLLEERFFNDLDEAYHYSVDPEKIKYWFDQGLIYYYTDKYLPAFLYLAEDIYAKKFQLERDKEHIITEHGQGGYDAQEKALGAVFREKYDARLLVGEPGQENNLVILPISKFAASFMIEGLESMAEDQQFKIKRVSAASKKTYGQPDFLNDAGTYEHKKEHFDRLSLRDAYSYWLIKSSPEVRENITAQDIIRYYINGSPIRTGGDAAEKKAMKAQSEKFKASLQKEGERLFKIFLDSELTVNDKVRLETEWNAKFNNYVPVDYNKVPVAFTMARYYKGKEELLRPEKREAVAFMLTTGTQCLAYDVGAGKTPSACFTISAFLDAGFCRRPFVCVPNQVYKQFIQEIKEFCPQIPVLEAYNFGDGYIQNFQGADGQITPVPSGCITVMTYEGLEQIGFNDSTFNELFDQLYTILDQGGASEQPQSQQQKEGFAARLETILGKGLKGSLYNIEDFGFDFACYDEAHKLKKVFTSVKGEAETDEKGKPSRGRNPYLISSGQPSSIGLKAFMLNQYILKRNGYQNILLLTATPFTNSPLEIFSMLAMLAWEQLQATDLQNIKNFFDTYIQTSTELVINSKLKPEFKQVILGFNNLVSLQTLIRRFINYKTGEDVNVQRPAKYVLPYTHKLVDGTLIELSPEERVESYLPMTPQQKAMMDDIIGYVEGTIPFGELGSASYTEEETPLDEESSEVQSEGEAVDEADMSDDEKAGVRNLRGMNFARNLALSPYLYAFSGLGKPTWYDYVESSPKLKYTCECIRTVKEWHESRNEPVSGQVIYIDRGIEYFELIRQYLIQEVGFKPHEVAIIKSGMPAGSKKGSKEFIKNLFNGELYNISTKTFETVTDDQRIKVIIGSSTIKEGINLQRYSTCLYDLWLDWNPTDFWQLCGRIWRQGNLFSSVRIPIPLVVDSMDIFIFQKLQEKTSRLNTLWSTDGRKNVLKLEEFDPAELKYALIRNPMTVAQLQVIGQQAAIEGELLGIKRLSERIARIKENVEEITSALPAAVKIAQEYRSFERSEDQLTDARRLVGIIQEIYKSQTDRQGLKMVENFGRKYSGEPADDFSIRDPFYKPYWFDAFNLAQRNLTREVRDFITPSGIPFRLDDTTGLDVYATRKEASIAELEARKTALSDKENLQRLADEVILDREERKIGYKPLHESVQDFTTLNYLLGDRKIITRAERETFTSCPPMENGRLATSPAALAYLDKCLENIPQTKEGNLQEDGTYTPGRRQLHTRIIASLVKGIRCVTRGKPIAVFTGGSPGAGKSHFLREHAQYLLSPEVFHLDADEIRAMLPEYAGWNANSTQAESKDIVDELLTLLGEGRCHYDFIYDGTMNKAIRYFPLIKKAKEMGYETFIIFINIPYSVAKKRVLERYQKTGRYVPMAILEEFHEKLPSGKTRGQDALDMLKPVVDGYVVVDGVTGKITEHHGIQLPADRSYGELLNLPPPEMYIVPPETKTPEPETEPAADKTTLERYIQSLKLSLKYLEPADKKAAQARIKTLQLSLKYL